MGREAHSDRTFWRVGYQKPFIQQLPQKFATGSLSHAGNPNDIPTPHFTPQQCLLQHVRSLRFKGLVFRFWSGNKFCATHGNIAVDTIKKAVELQQALHERDLIQATLQKKTAERNKSFVGEVPPAVIIVVAMGISATQRGHVLVPLPGKAAADVPEAIAGQRQAQETGIGVEPGDPAVAVEKGVDPHQAMMGRGNGDKRHNPMVFAWGVCRGKATEEGWKLFPGRSDMPAHDDLPLPDFAGPDFHPFASVLVPYPAQFVRKLLIKNVMQTADKFAVSNIEVRGLPKTSLHRSLTVDMREAFLLQIALGRIGGIVLQHGAFNIDRVGTVTLDEVGIITVD